MEDDETFEHWITDCPVMRITRSEIFGVATNNYVILSDEWDLNKVLKFSFTPIIASIIETGNTFNNVSIELGPETALEPD